MSMHDDRAGWNTFSLQYHCRSQQASKEKLSVQLLRPSASCLWRYRKRDQPWLEFISYKRCELLSLVTFTCQSKLTNCALKPITEQFQKIRSLIRLLKTVYYFHACSLLLFLLTVVWLMLWHPIGIDAKSLEMVCRLMRIAIFVHFVAEVQNPFLSVSSVSYRSYTECTKK